MLSFLTQLASALDPGKTGETVNALAHPKPKIELQIASRTKKTHDGYGFMSLRVPELNLRFSTTAIRTLRFPQRSKSATSRSLGTPQLRQYLSFADSAPKANCSE